MNKATFRAVREECGLSQQDVADEFNVDVRSVKRWEKGDSGNMPPEDVCAWLLSQRESLYATAEIMAEKAVELAKRTGESFVAVRYYRTQDELDAYRFGKGLASLPLGYVNATSRIAAIYIEDEDYHVEYFYPDQMRVIKNEL